MGYRVAVVGATGNVGREMFNILEEVEFPVDKMHAIASRKSIGVEVGWKNGVIRCEDIEQFDFSRVDVVLMSVSGDFSRQWSPRIGKAGPLVIDNSSAWRMDPDVPLIDCAGGEPGRHRVGAPRRTSSPTPTARRSQLVVVLKPLHDAATIKRCVVATYQSVSGAGKAAMDELWDQTKQVFVLGPSEPQVLPPKQIAFNVIPFIGNWIDDGYTDEELQDMERDPQDPRPGDQAHGHLRAGAGIRGPLRGCAPGIRARYRRGRSARDPARGAGRARGR